MEQPDSTPLDPRDVLDQVGPDIPSDLLISLITGPMLVGIAGSTALTDFIQDIGRASEELFRGDRLPLLNLHDHQADPSNPDETKPDAS